jgi:hypothetical protein
MAWNIDRSNSNPETKNCELITHPYITIANQAYE